jgi:hypothetical protein
MVKSAETSTLLDHGSWLRAVGREGAVRALRLARRILGSLFLTEPDPEGSLPVGMSGRSMAGLWPLRRLLWREDELARGLGSLARAFGRQGHHGHARRLAWEAFGCWCRARRLRERLGRAAEGALWDPVR